MGTSYMDVAVEAGSTYFYVVRAVDKTGIESTNSDEVKAITPPP